MKRYVLIFLLMLLPFQFSWAAVAAYCQHETERSTQHIGHHQVDAGAKLNQLQDGNQDHDLNLNQDQDQNADQALNDGGDADCSFCHFSCSKPMNSHAAWLPAAAEKNSFTPSLPTLYLSHIGESPEEPDWMLAA